MHHKHEPGLDLTSSLIKDHEVILKMLERLEAKLVGWKSSRSVDNESLAMFLKFLRRSSISVIMARRSVVFSHALGGEAIQENMAQ